MENIDDVVIPGGIRVIILQKLNIPRQDSKTEKTWHQDSKTKKATTWSFCGILTTGPPGMRSVSQLLKSLNKHFPPA